MSNKTPFDRYLEAKQRVKALGLGKAKEPDVILENSPYVPVGLHDVPVHDATLVKPKCSGQV